MDTTYLRPITARHQHEVGIYSHHRGKVRIITNDATEPAIRSAHGLIWDTIFSNGLIQWLIGPDLASKNSRRLVAVSTETNPDVNVSLEAVQGRLRAVAEFVAIKEA